MGAESVVTDRYASGAWRWPSEENPNVDALIVKK